MNFSIRSRFPFAGVIECFKYKNSGALSDDESVSSFVKGTGEFYFAVSRPC